MGIEEKNPRWLPKYKMATKVFSEQLYSYAEFKFKFGGESDLNWLSYGNFKIDCSHVSRRVSRRTGENYPWKTEEIEPAKRLNQEDNVKQKFNVYGANPSAYSAILVSSILFLENLDCDIFSSNLKSSIIRGKLRKSNFL